jgi:hypothetical protein
MISSLLGLVVSGPAAALSVVVGAALAAGNLLALARIVAAVLPRTASGASRSRESVASWALLGLLKALALVAVVGLLLRYAGSFVSPVAMMVGFGSLPIGVAIGSLVSDRAAGSEES